MRSHLSARENLILTSQAYLNDIILNNTLQLIQGAHPTMHYKNTYYMEYLTNPSYGTSTQRCLHTLLQQPRSLWYIPVNHGQTHWLFLTINIAQRHIGQHDSLPGHTNRDYAEQVRLLLTAADQGQWTSAQVSTSRQTNTYNCGLYVLANILRLVSNPHGPTGTPS